MVTDSKEYSNYGDFMIYILILTVLNKQKAPCNLLK